MALDIRKPLKKFLPHLTKAADDNLNEADTVQRLIKVFEEVLGYDALSEISREASVKDKFVDVALKIDGAIRVLVEAKSAATTLRDRHIDQAQAYAANANIRWVLLTNGLAWNLYHLTFEEGIESTLAFSVNLADADDLDRSAELLALLHRQSVKKGELEQYWDHRVALGAASIGRALFAEDCLRFIRRDIRRREGVLIDEEDLAKAIHEMLCAEARELIGPMKIRRRSRKAKPDASGAPAEAPAEPGAPPKEPTG